MNFFEAQAQAQRHTFWLLVLFALAVAALVLLTNLLILGVLVFTRSGVLDFSLTALRQQFEPGIFVMVGLVIVLFVLFGSMYKTALLAKGGRSIAEALGGVQIPRSSSDPRQRRLLNVVEEMAIASGIAVPPVYLLDEAGINAFAAGWSPNSAVIGISRGAVEQLSRDELQGVIAHEFSHIFNGDMRLNIRLVGMLHGILLIGLTGYYLLRAMRYLRSGSGNRKGGGIILAVLVLGVGLVVIGYSGHFFGQWIKSVVSRQREYLADATAVRYTRNAGGIAGALKKIGGKFRGSRLAAPAAPEYSHAYFADAVGGFAPWLFATHPPLKERIRRIEPRWDGSYPKPTPPEPVVEAPAPAAGSGADAMILSGALAAGALDIERFIGLIGKVGDEQIATAQEIITAIPAALRQAVEEPFGARAVVYGLLLDAGEDMRRQQLALLEAQAEPAVCQLLRDLEPGFQQLPDGAALPLLEMVIPVLRTLSAEQYRQFRAMLQELIGADRKVDFREWILQRFLLRQLDEAFGLRRRPPAQHNHLGAVKRPAEILLSLLAYLEHRDDATAEQAFNAARQHIGAGALRFIRRADLDLRELDRAIDALDELKPLLKPRLLKAGVACLLFDGKPTVRGLELLRTVASCLDSPMPPLLRSG